MGMSQIPEWDEEPNRPPGKTKEFDVAWENEWFGDGPVGNPVEDPGEGDKRASEDESD
jgi:hypothetical protein